MVREDDVAAAYRDVFNEQIINAARDDERKRQRVVLGPCDFVECGPLKLVADFADVGQAHGTTAVDTDRAFARAGHARIADLLKNQNHSRFERGARGPAERGGTGALAEGAFLVRPGVELDTIVEGANGEGLHRFEHRGASGIEPFKFARLRERELIIAAGEKWRGRFEQGALPRAAPRATR